MTASRRPLASPEVPVVSDAYAQAVETVGAARWLHVSGQIPLGPDGVPDGFAAQARLTLANVERQFAAAAMTLDHLVKLTVFLASREDRIAFRDIRTEWLAGRRPALTVVVCEIFDAAWLIEVEAVAAA
jgi:enamine deaminase RidA (YjgF/YER057c/UK114 family)